MEASSGRVWLRIFGNNRIGLCVTVPLALLPIFVDRTFLLQSVYICYNTRYFTWYRATFAFLKKKKKQSEVNTGCTSVQPFTKFFVMNIKASTIKSQRFIILYKYILFYQCFLLAYEFKEASISVNITSYSQDTYIYIRFPQMLRGIILIRFTESYSPW